MKTYGHEHLKMNVYNTIQNIKKLEIIQISN